MKITSHQAAELLNCNPTTVWNLVKSGKIKNYAIPGPGKSRVEGKFELAEIAEFAKTFIARKRGAPKKEKVKKEKKEVSSKILDILLERTKEIAERLETIVNRVENLEHKLDTFIKSWT